MGEPTPLGVKWCWNPFRRRLEPTPCGHCTLGHLDCSAAHAYGDGGGLQAGLEIFFSLEKCVFVASKF